MTAPTRLADLPSLTASLAQHQIRPQRALGQNFLLDMSLLRRIAQVGGAKDAVVLEIGAGPGGLTRALLMEGARHVMAIEQDRQFAPMLQTLIQTAPHNLSVHFADALAWLRHTPSPLPVGHHVIANLPYNIATALLVSWLKDTGWDTGWQSLTLLLQKEVAERLTAEPRHTAYGRLSVLGHWRAHIRACFDIPARAFTPAPKVASQLVQLTRRTNPIAVNISALDVVLSTGFGQRRKMLRRALKPLFSSDQLTALGLAPTARAQDLSVAQFCKLAQAYADASFD